MSFQVLQQQELFNFRRFLDRAPRTRELDTEFQLRALSSAEFQVVQESVVAGHRIQPPVEVGDAAARLAIAKYDCSPWDLHRPNTLNEAQMHDIVVLSGDVSKLHRIGVGDPMRLFDGFEEHFLRLSDYHREYEGLRYIVESGGLFFQALTWLAKLSLLAGADTAERITRFRSSVKY